MQNHSYQTFGTLKSSILQCQLCAKSLAHGVRPVVQIDPRARILIAGQAPGRVVHESAIPFDDKSGDRLRQWVGLTKTEFYDPALVAILPMGFCFPGSGKSGDLAPRKECAPAWRQLILDQLPNIQLTLAIGTYAQKWHLGKSRQKNLTETVKAWQSYPESIIPLPHPSPRNFHWLQKNPWFESDLIPQLKQKVSTLRALGIN